MNLTKWQKLRAKCEFKIDKKGFGLWCSKDDVKCSFVSCRPPVSNGTTLKPNSDIVDGGVDSLGGLTVKQQKALKFHNEGLSLSSISKKMNISKQGVDNLLKKAQRKVGLYKERGLTAQGGGLTIRLHNDSFWIEANNNLDIVKGKLIHLKNKVSYRKIRTDEYDMRVFKSSVIVQFLKDIAKTSSSEAKINANERVLLFLGGFSSEGIELGLKYKLLSRHYGILKHGLAIERVSKGRKILIWDKGKIRNRIDTSVLPAELDSESVVDGEEDTNKWQSFGMDVNNGVWEGHKNSVRYTVEILRQYAEQMNLHLSVMQEIKDTLKELREEKK